MKSPCLTLCGKLLLCLVPFALVACGALGTAGPSAEKSTITAAPGTVTSDGKAVAAIAVTLRDPYGQPYKGSAKVEISASPCDHCTLNYATQNGKTTGTLASTMAQDATLRFTVNGVASPSKATVHFVFDETRPDIVLIITDDIGIDQWKLFGYGGPKPAATPNLDTIAQGGVKFHNMWSMPACSNARATIFTGRWPLRTNVLTALGPDDLANYMVNPNEMTLPKLLKQRGYKSALFGKFHLGIQSNDPYGYGMVHALGFDYYDGWLDASGDLSPIDTTAGGVAAERGTWSCGFVRDGAHGGADEGACYAADHTCQELVKSGPEAPGRICRDSGGIFDPNQSCTSPVPSYINFNTLSAYYVSPLVINNENGLVERVPPTDIRARTFRGTELVNAAVTWVKQQRASQPWMVTLSFATVHNPVMQPPATLLPATEPDSSNLDCADIEDQKILANEMEEALDTEIGRFMVETGLASRGPDGQLVYDPQKTNTYVIFVADNGSNALIVNPPFDPTRAKSLAYQTGVWVPGIVSGPNINQPGRETNAMVNVADIYQLVGELAGMDVHKIVPRSLDSQPMLPYLENSAQREIRTTNFTQIGTNLHRNGGVNGPCVFQETACSQIAPTKEVCDDNNGQWWGPDPDVAAVGPAGLPSCCAVAVWQHYHEYEPQVKNIYPSQAYAIRNDDYKIVVNKVNTYVPAANACTVVTSTEFYKINEDVPRPKLDTAKSNLLDPEKPPLNSTQRESYEALSADLDTILSSQPACPADVNLDGVVNQADVQQWQMFKRLAKGKSSWADINQDGLTNETDKALIERSFGLCPAADEAGAASPRR